MEEKRRVSRLENWKTPLILLATLILAFGTQLHQLGYYWDDWPVIYLTHTQGTHEFWSFYQYDRPISAWTYILTTPILGTNPLGWHIFTLLLRWLTTVFAWLTFRSLWPGKTIQATWIAFLFGIYPSFDQQAISVAFSQHWICYLLYMVSLWMMIRAVRQRSTILFVTSWLPAGLHLLTMEYFAGLELIRPIILFFLAQENDKTWKDIVKFTLKKWAPYLLIFMTFLIWRSFLLEFPGDDPNPLVMLESIKDNPLSGFRQLIQVLLTDTIYLIAGVWGKATAKNFLKLGSPFFRLAFILSLLNVLIFWLYFRKGMNKRQVTRSGPVRWEIQAIGLGLAAIFAGTLPAWLAGRSVTFSFFSSRFALAGMLGSGLFIVGLLELLTIRLNVKIAFMAVMILVSTNYHIRIGNQYKNSWDQQREFYWQLHWRAPNIEPNTPIISDNEVLLYAGGYATALGVNLAYHEGAQPDDLAYWFFNLDDKLDGQIRRFNEGKALRAKLRILKFSGKSHHSLVIDNGYKECLKVIENDRVENELLPTNFERLYPVASLDRIPDNQIGNLPPQSIFGPEPDHTWCYYYQKAELARQQKDWEKISLLADQVLDKGFSPNKPVEWLVFIEGYALSGQGEAASNLTIEIHQSIQDFSPMLCALWSQLEKGAPKNSTLAITSSSLQEKLVCIRD